MLTATPGVNATICACIVALALFAAPALAGDVNCAEVAAQDVYACSIKAYDAADKDLNEVYRQVMADQDDEAARAKLKAAQRDWLKFRDSECAFETSEYEGSKLADDTDRMCRTRLAKARTKALRDFMACQKDAKKCAW